MIADRLPRPLGSLLVAVLLSGCALFGKGGTEEVGATPRSPLESAAGFIDRGAFADAEGTLRQAASSCSSGETGRRALLLLTSLQLDPRNPAQSADSAALMAIRYLALPDAVPSERPLALSMYALALDLGANPSLRPASSGAPGSIAVRFSDCGAVATSAEPLLPKLEAQGRASVGRQTGQQRDSLATQVTQLTERNRALEKKVQDLEAELARVRRLLGGPPPPP